jgi:hypothetical protein
MRGGARARFPVGETLPQGMTVISDPNQELRQHWQVRAAPFVVVMDFEGMVVKKGTAGTEDLVNSFFQDALKLQPKTEDQR